MFTTKIIIPLLFALSVSLNSQAASDTFDYKNSPSSSTFTKQNNQDSKTKFSNIKQERPPIKFLPWSTEQLSHYYLTKKLFLGKISKNFIPTIHAHKIECRYAQSENHIKEICSYGSEICAKNYNLIELFDLFEKEEQSLGCEVLVQRTIEEAVIKICKKRLASETACSQIFLELALNFFDTHGTRAQTSQFYLVGVGNKCQNPYTIDDNWSKELIPQENTILELLRTLPKKCIERINGPIASFCYNNDGTALGIGTHTGQVYFINLVTKQINTLNAKPQFTHPIYTVFFDAEEETLFGTNQEGIIQGWHLPTKEKTLSSIISMPGYFCIPNISRTKLLLVSVQQQPNFILCPLKKLSAGERVLLRSTKNTKLKFSAFNFFLRYTVLTENYFANFAL